MARTVLLLITGAILGGVAVYLYAERVPGPLETSLTARPEGSPPNAGGSPGTTDVEFTEPAASGGIVSARVAAYERALEASDAIDLESMIELTAAAPRSRARDLDLAALMTRLAELDPERAVDFARSAYLDTPLLIQAFAALARTDAGAALAQLASVTPASKQRRIAVALLDVVAPGAGGVERIAAALPDEARAGFELDALLARARIDPAGAMREAVGRNGMLLQSYILPRLAEAAVQADPRSALALAELIDDYGARRSYGSAVLTAWAELDPGAVFAFLETAEPGELSMSTGAFAALARHAPDQLLAMVETLPPGVRTTARRAVIQTVAERDPEAALAMLDTLPPGQDRESMLSTIAQTYGRRGPEQALAWVRAMSPPSPAALQGVLQGIAAVDADRAIDLFIQELENQGSRLASGADGAGALLQGSMAFSMMLSLMTSNTDVGRLADRLLELDDPQVRSQFSLAISLWSSRDSEAAMSWALANADRLDPSALRSVAQQMANQNLELAVSTLDRVPASHRAGWIEGVASAMAQSDIGRAQGFLERLRGQPGFDRAYGAVAREMARTDPAAAARMLSDAPSSSTALEAAAFTVAREWANRDPAAAARWALSLDDEPMRRSTLGNVVSAWAQRDAPAAERWLFSLNDGPGRDAAADGYIDTAAQAGRFEPRLLEAYSSEQRRQQGVSRAIVAIGRSDPAEAKRLLDGYLTDPAIRAQTEERLARSSGAGSGVLISDGNVIFVQ